MMQIIDTDRIYDKYQVNNPSTPFGRLFGSPLFLPLIIPLIASFIGAYMLIKQDPISSPCSIFVAIAAFGYSLPFLAVGLIIMLSLRAFYKPAWLHVLMYIFFSVIIQLALCGFMLMLALRA